MKRTLLGCSGLLVSFLLCILVGVVGVPQMGFWPILGRVICDASVVGEATSPDGKYLATSILTNCGATTPFGTDVVVREAGTWFGLGEREVVLSANTKIKVNLNWQDDRTLLIEYEDRKVLSRSDNPWRDVSFVFRKIE